MAVMNSVPPQAYTRDVLVKAIEWLGTQSPAVRERANSADLIVSYYLQACRRNAASLEAPVSQEVFKSDLKHLAQDLKQFEEPVAPPPPSRTPSHGLPEDFHARVEPIFNPPPPPAPRAPPLSAPTWSIDPRSLSAARELQQRLNLGSEGEAIRMLITLGLERAKQLFGP